MEARGGEGLSQEKSYEDAENWLVPQKFQGQNGWDLATD